MDHENKNEYGEYTGCTYFKVTGSGKHFCKVLRDWYNADEDNDHCFGCPFYKTAEQAERELKKSDARLRRLRIEKVIYA